MVNWWNICLVFLFLFLFLSFFSVGLRYFFCVLFGFFSLVIEIWNLILVNKFDWLIGIVCFFNDEFLLIVCSILMEEIIFFWFYSEFVVFIWIVVFILSFIVLFGWIRLVSVVDKFNVFWCCWWKWKILDDSSSFLIWVNWVFVGGIVVVFSLWCWFYIFNVVFW